ncbi:hypothetical protein [Faecalibaculum rodentium]|uniref:hypothetical protein n=1 Tax=Faecalibaculum rodentium TaxID=1702221 RepID=UPI001F57C77B|nr:hypothetical protein [Faecalibaculum rodentium]
MKEDKDTKFDFSWFYFLGTVLVILKALNLTAIPWLWAMAPFWIPWALALFLSLCWDSWHLFSRDYWHLLSGLAIYGESTSWKEMSERQ